MRYETSTDHLLDELDRIDTLLAGFRERLGEDELEVLDRDADSKAGDPTALSPAIPAAEREEVRTVGNRIDDAVEEARSDGVRLRLARVAEAFDLTRRHLDVLVLALAPDFDTEYHDTFRAIQDGHDLDRPTVSLIADLFGTTDAERLTAATLVGEESPLREHDLITLETVSDAGSSRLLRTVSVTDRLHSFLGGAETLDPRLAAVASLVPATIRPEDLRLDEAVAERIPTTVDTDAPARRCYYYGPDGSEKHRATEALAGERVVRASLPAVLETGALDRLRREAALLAGPLHLTDADAVLEYADATLESVFDALAGLDVDVFVTGTESWTPTGTMATELDAIVEFPYPSLALRKRFWESHTDELPEDVDPVALAGTFRLTQGELDAALATARSLADGALTAEDVYRGCSAQSAGELEELAQHIEPASDWADIELPDETERKLRIVRDHVKHQARIYSDWGFEEQFSRGTGVVALFSGPSGTGKTMAAEVLAGDVGMDLYKIDLSAVVSKYIGETEGNLEEIFEAAENSNAILLFDEADAVFGDRAEVSSATDRYANVEVNYLLQRIEAYDGVVLLTTNYEENIDSAFTRRIDHSVSFRLPEEATRDAIWRGIFPADAPLGDIDYEFLAERDFSGGQIKTIGQTAAILAADDGRIEMSHVVEAIQLEFQKSDKPLYPPQFGQYRQYLYGLDERATGPQRDEPDAESSEPERPEAVVRSLFEGLRTGDHETVQELFHPDAVADEFTYKELQIISQDDLAIVTDFERVRDDPGRAVVRFTQDRNGREDAMEYELRTDADDEEWLVFDYRRAREDDVIVDD